MAGSDSTEDSTQGSTEGVAISSAGANHSLWLAPLIAAAGLLSYFTLFARWPVFRDTAWLNFLILFAALAISAMAWRRAWPRGGWRRLAGFGSVLVSGGLGGLLVAYVFFLSNGLPTTEGVTAEGEAVPVMTLTSYDGSRVNVAAAGGDSTILVFYRGFW
jgi:hypothetical protein